MTEFKVGDSVEAWGVRGTVVSTTEVPVFPIRVLFPEERLVPGDKHECFMLDGRYESWHLEPSLKLIERPKKKVTKTVERFLSIYSDGSEHLWDGGKTQPQLPEDASLIAFVKMTGTYEVEE